MQIKNCFLPQRTQGFFRSGSTSVVVIKLVDLKNCLYGDVFGLLKDIEKFKQFKLSDWTVEWYNGADFAPEYLYENGI